MCSIAEGQRSRPTGACGVHKGAKPQWVADAAPLSIGQEILPAMLSRDISSGKTAAGQRFEMMHGWMGCMPRTEDVGGREGWGISIRQDAQASHEGLPGKQCMPRPLT